MPPFLVGKIMKTQFTTANNARPNVSLSFGQRRPNDVYIKHFGGAQTVGSLKCSQCTVANADTIIVGNWVVGATIKQI